MKVSIADDDPVSRRMLQSYQQKWGYEVAEAVNGAVVCRRPFHTLDDPPAGSPLICERGRWNAE